MSKLVQKVFSFVATSIQSEQVFSASGNVITDEHKWLTSEHADQLVFLFENSQYLGVSVPSLCITFIIATLQFHL